MASQLEGSDSISGVCDGYIYLDDKDNTLAEISSQNIKCLQPNTYLNDDVIHFYIAYLIYNQCPMELVKKVHVFDNIFHKLLMETFINDRFIDGDPKMPGPPEVVYSKWKTLDKWFNGIDIFEKDFLIFPVCRDEHWFAIIVCYPSEVREFYSTNIEPSPASNSSRYRPVPGILVLDSLRLKNQTITRHVRDFLDYEWRTRATVVKDFHYYNLPQYHPDLPKQTNAYDCGIYLLAYLKAFIKHSDRFYRHVTKPKEDSVDILNTFVNDALVGCSRESIRSLIKRQCKVKKSNSDQPCNS